MSKLRPYDELTPKERQQRAILRQEMEAKGMLTRSSVTIADPADVAKFDIGMTFSGVEEPDDRFTVTKFAEVEPEPESPPTQPEGAPLPVPEENCRQLAYTPSQIPTGGCR